jgi:hypothetical protein
MCYDNTNHKVVEGEGCIGKVVRGSRSQLLNQTQKQELEQRQKNMEEKVLKFTTHNEYLIK